MDAQQQLDNLAHTMINNQVGAELAQTATQLVMGSGSPTARIVLIGEAPGKSEDQMGQPFVGASGTFLDTMLAAAGLSRDEVYITNIVKYRPPNNRDPRPAEIAAFWPYLLQQLAIIQPTVCLSLGRFSMNCFLPDARISEQHGQPVEYHANGVQFLLIPLYHPAAALYNGQLRQTLIDDFVAAARLARERAS